jgi:hypothetical protein
MASRPYYHWLVIATVCVGAFMGRLDASIAQLVLEHDFGQRLAATSWVSVADMLALAALLGRLGGARRIQKLTSN